ncbi:MAG: deoxyribonuclease [Gammaproteobacteria bacterium RIFCSPLOWO2_02_FULL_42_14]|nr:MAG: deoxyribonuclease [Gammaproteobacteria bacterium RIFCSPHIGHO2_02_FULL_42_43]OGT27855.1 MAG: deoxyribonuclease [Gammaproteobacteria bacterium RIFCSPHIGHO2_01_FULL_42_8]OGT51149.1 MAG: deoxyribonuclease [Gammaproteobacteria bacterium RIFCSPHIGHO2_12_FULL_41_25]OGT62911.1 MAG: deoxyribonuclease [Gammaproteobacteria bacterium RIFCSPLOWO2_02_FULL_42_14]OGT86042.1 MAG: deoxyribonuclease [Gammaproteobacteria bacterium RIFCSPLOWO2_12_FULL_42_18]
MLVDSHCHLYMLDLSSYDNNFDRFITETKKTVEKMLCVAVDMDTAKKCISIAEQYDDIYASVGSHPSEKAEDDLSMEAIVSLSQHPKVIAIGETGLDYHYNHAHLDVMRERFRLHIRAAHCAKKPLIIHSRAAQKDTIDIMREENARDVRGVMHCFTESLEMAREAVDLNFYISFSGIITFKNAADLVEVVKALPLEKILIETDAPYLAPVPFRGKQNEPRYVQYVAQKIAEIKKMDVETVALQTTKNFNALFAAR